MPLPIFFKPLNPNIMDREFREIELVLHSLITEQRDHAFVLDVLRKIEYTLFSMKTTVVEYAEYLDVLITMLNKPKYKQIIDSNEQYKYVYQQLLEQTEINKKLMKAIN